MKIFDLSRGSTPRPNFTVTSEGVVLNQWGLNPPTPGKSNTENIYRVSHSISNKVPAS